MRIEDTYVSKASGSRSGEVAGTPSTKLEAHSGKVDGQEASGDDLVSLSASVGLFPRALAVGAEQRVLRVQQLSEEVQSGRYRVDSLELSRAMIGESLGRRVWNGG